MKFVDGFILFDGADNQAHKTVHEFTCKVGKNLGKIENISLAELEQWESSTYSEVGVLLVPVSKQDDLKPIRQLITNIRSNNGNLMVAALTSDSELSKSFELGEQFNLLLDINWMSAEQQLSVFFQFAKLSTQNHAFRAFLNHAVDGYWVWHIVSDVIEWSDRTAAMTNLTPAQAPRNLQSFLDMIHEDDREPVGQAVQAHLQDNVAYSDVPMRMRIGEGQYGQFVANGQALRDVQGKPLIFVGSLTDVTAIESVKQKLDDTQKRFSVLFNYMNDAAVLADVETGIILEANVPAERLWGKPVSELVGMHQSLLHPPNLSAEAIQVFQEHIINLQKHKHDSVSVPVLAAGQVEIPAEISSSLIELEGKMTILGVFRDISERVKNERELRERDAEVQLSSHLASMGTLAAGVAHEINNPLTYVLGNLDIIKEYLQEHAAMDSAINQTVDLALSGGAFVREIVSDLKAISRMDNSENSCNANEVIRIATRMAMSDLRHKGHVDLDLEETPHVSIASARLSQVILNLLSNAARAFKSPDRKDNTITVTSRMVDDLVKIDISDNGLGISQEDLKNIWKPFFTKQKSTGGTGLGLPICRRILEEVGASLDIVSDLGHGTKVTIQLPVDTSDKTIYKETLENNSLQLNTKPTLLIVDDDKLVTTVIEHMLRKDFDTTIFNDARPAVSLIKSGTKFDLVICDIMMPEMDGKCFYHEINGMLPIMYITGGAVTEENIKFEKKMLKKGRLLHKPFQKTDLCEKIIQVLSEDGYNFDYQNNDLYSDKKLIELHNHLADAREFLGEETLRTQLGKTYDKLVKFQNLLADGTYPQCAEHARKLTSSTKLLGLHDLSEELLAAKSAASAEHPQAFEQSVMRLLEPTALLKRYLSSLR